MIASIILNDMERSHQSAYGYRSWMLQDIEQPYEVILNLFNDETAHFETLGDGRNVHCETRISSYAAPRFFNIAAANNLGLFHARGKYVLFANSDIIYPSPFLRVLIGELSERRLAFALGSRVNLNSAQTSCLRNPEGYSKECNFDFLMGYENLPGRTLSLGCSPWTALRSVAEAVGGFDPRILCHEDAEFNDRVMHYLRRQNLQQCLFAVTDLYGYHLDHPPSELYEASVEAKGILEPRRQRLLADPGSCEDISPARLDSLDALLQDVYGTRGPSVAFTGRRRWSDVIAGLKQVARLVSAR